MMKLVITMMSKQGFSSSEKKEINDFLTTRMNSKSELFVYKEDVFFELDIDLIEVEFQKETIYSDIDNVISLCEYIIKNIKANMDFIIANDDTATEVEKYIANWNDIKDFGLFITSREIPDLSVYYSSKICNAYLNFEHVSFGCIFN